MEKLKLNSRLKKIFISLFLALVCFVGLCGIGLKANAYTFGDNGVRIDFDNDTTIVYFNLPYDTASVELLKDSRDGTILNLTFSGYTYDVNGDIYVQYYANNNSLRPMYSNKLYAFAFDQTIHHYIFYQIDFELTSPDENGYFNYEQSDFTVIELFTISASTGYVDYCEIISNAFISRRDVIYSTSGYVDHIQTYLAAYSDTISFFNYAKREYRYGYNTGYSSGYSTGYSEGQSGENAISPVWNVLTGIFNSIGAILSIELIPHIPIGLLIFVPLFFIMVMAILSIWRKNW